MLKLKKDITRRGHQTRLFGKFNSQMTAGSTLLGRIVWATGAGKSISQCDAIAVADAIAVSKLHLIIAPTINLAHQHIGNAISKLDGEFVTVSFNSSKALKGDRVVAQTTSADELAAVLADNAGKTVIVVSTYASMGELAGFDWDTIQADESQKLIGKSTSAKWETLAANVAKLSYTATERFTKDDNGTGLNNEALYGKRIDEATSAELIATGDIVKAVFHIMSADTEFGSSDEATLNTVISALRKQVEHGESTLGAAKVLTSARGKKQLGVINANVATIQKEFVGYDVYVCHSHKSIGYTINGVKVSYKEWFDGLNSSTKVLVFHHDMLAEGVDVKGITGVVLLRKLAQDKLIQTIGRAVRTAKGKTEALVTAVILDGDSDNALTVGDIIECYNGNGYDITSDIVKVTDSKGNELKTDDDKFKAIAGLDKIFNVADIAAMSDAELAADLW